MCLVSRAGADGAHVTYTRCEAKGLLSGIAGLTATGSATLIAADCGRLRGCSAAFWLRGPMHRGERLRRVGRGARPANSVLVELKLAPTVPD